MTPESTARAALAETRPADPEDFDHFALGRQPVAGAEIAGANQVEHPAHHLLPETLLSIGSDAAAVNDFALARLAMLLPRIEV